MSEGLNLVTLIGNIGTEPELTQTSAGARLKMRLATTEVYFDKENKKHERTEWHTVKTFGRRAEGLAKVLEKGEKIFVRGRLETSTYDDKEGRKQTRTDVIATDVILGGRGRDRDRDRDRDRERDGDGAVASLRSPSSLASPASLTPASRNAPADFSTADLPF